MTEKQMAQRGPGWVDLWVQFSSSTPLHLRLQHLVWADEQGFTHLVVPEDDKSFSRYKAAAAALQIRCRLHQISPTTLNPDPAARVPPLIRMPPQLRDLKKLARLVGQNRLAGKTIILVGPEHNREVQRHPELLRYVASAGAAFCGLARSLADRPGYSAKSTARRLIALGYYSYLAGFVTAGVHPQEILQKVSRISPSWRRTQSTPEEIVRLRPRRLMKTIFDDG